MHRLILAVLVLASAVVVEGDCTAAFSKPLILRKIPAITTPAKIFGCPVPFTSAAVRERPPVIAKDLVAVTIEQTGNLDELISCAEAEQLAQITLLRADDFNQNLENVESALLRIQHLWTDDRLTAEQRSWLCKAFWVLAIHTKVILSKMKIKGYVGEFDQQSVCSMLWAFAVSGLQPTKEVMQEMQERAAAIMHTFTHDSVAAALWSLATLGAKPRRGLVDALQNRALELSEKFGREDVVQILWALAKLGVVPKPALLDVLQPRSVLSF